MIRKNAINLITKYIGNEPIIAANGFISRDLFNVNNKPTNFYMIGSMGLASSIGLGIALKNPKKRIFVFDGDGNILMNLGSLTTIGSLKPKNFIHIVFDNSSHESTGGQPTNTEFVHIDKIAKSCNYNKVYRLKKKSDVLRIFNKLKSLKGPIMIVIKIKNSNQVSQRIDLNTITIKNRFMSYLKR